MSSLISRFIFVFIVLLPFCAMGDSLENMVSNLIIEKLGSNISEVDLNFDNKSKIFLPKITGRDVKNVQLTYFAPNYSSFRVSVTMENDMIYDLFGRYSAYINVPITSRTIAVGTIVTEAEVTSIRSSPSKAKAGYITALDEVLGMQVKRSLASGVLIRHSDVIKPQVVRQGDGVDIVYNSGNIKLRTSGVALQSGAIGDNLRVKNDTTGTIVSGVVRGKNLIEVGGEQ